MCIIQKSLVKDEPEFPIFISGDLAPEKDLFSFGDLLEISESKQGKVTPEHLREIIPLGSKKGIFQERKGSAQREIVNEKEYQGILAALKGIPDLSLLANELARFRQENNVDNGDPEKAGILRHIDLVDTVASAGEARISLRIPFCPDWKRTTGGAFGSCETVRGDSGGYTPAITFDPVQRNPGTPLED